MQLIYSTDVSLLFNIIPELSHVDISSWEELENSLAAEIELLLS
jgi:hypothetical protein